MKLYQNSNCKIDNKNYSNIDCLLDEMLSEIDLVCRDTDIDFDVEDQPSSEGLLTIGLIASALTATVAGLIKLVNRYTGLSKTTRIYLLENKQSLFKKKESIDIDKINNSVVPKSNTISTSLVSGILNITKRNVMMPTKTAKRILDGLTAIRKQLLDSEPKLGNLDIEHITNVLKNNLYREVNKKTLRIKSEIPYAVLVKHGMNYGDIGWSFNSIQMFCNQVVTLTDDYVSIKKYIAKLKVAEQEAIYKEKLEKERKSDQGSLQKKEGETVRNFVKSYLPVKVDPNSVIERIRFIERVLSVYIKESKRMYWLSKQLIDLVKSCKK